MLRLYKYAAVSERNWCSKKQMYQKSVIFVTVGIF